MNNDKFDQAQPVLERICKANDEIELIRKDIAWEYGRLSIRLQETGFVINKEVERIYKDIERLFNKKTTLEVENNERKKILNKLLGVNI